MAKIYVALRPKYTTRKAVDKILFNEGDFVTIVESNTPRYVLSMFETCHVAFVVDGKYYPVSVDNYEEQYKLLDAGESPTVEEDENFGIKKIENFVTYPDTEVASAIQENALFEHGILIGTLLKVTNYKEAPDPTNITKNGYWAVFKFDLASAEAEGYSELKLFDTEDPIVDGDNFVFMGSNEDEVNKKIFTIIGKLTVGGETGDVEQIFINLFKAKILNEADAINAIDVDGQGFDNLYDAFAFLKGKGGTITVNKSCEVPKGKNINLNDGKDYTLRIYNGATISLGRYISLSNNCYLNVVGYGVLKETNPYYAPIVMINTDNTKTANLYIDTDITLMGWTGIFVDKASYGINIVCRGTCVGQNDGYSNGAGVYVNGVVKDGVMTFSGSTEGTAGAGMYIAGNFKVVIYGARVIGSDIGIEQRAGKLYIVDSRIEGGTEEEATMTPNGSGSTSENCAVAIAQHTTKFPIDVIIRSSTLIGNAAFFEGNPQNNPDATKDTSIVIESGAFVGDIKTLADTDCTGFLYGGHYSKEPDAKYIAKGYEAVADTKETFNVVKKS